MQAEPSPTTGTFNMSLVMNKTVHSERISSPWDTSSNGAHDEGSLGAFEFKPRIRSSMSSGLSPLGAWVILITFLLFSCKMNYVYQFYGLNLP